ncbi:hypothetical protein MHW47_05875 [Streptomyces sp. OfavH-34-F]|uniref:hypothetical protein n=1 Tax=Streptomyces sp. OfavH-34-F TaxID=2917760 RepID=UPI001EF2BE4A|nr:hypothetical protein [Streptomyces sp. OfavH-34-F]MCG7523969.1 hypothetical protein [Streptomyces sp. OfavH-34-F]
MTSAALTSFPGDADSTTVAAALAELTAASALPFDQWDRPLSDRVQDLAGWLQCAAMLRGHELAEAPGPAGSSSHGVVHSLISTHASMLARHRAELAPFKGPDGALLGNDYDDHDEAADRHTDECVQMLGTVMAVLAGEFGRPADTTAPGPDVTAGMTAVLAAMTDPDLEGGDIVEAIKWRLRTLGFDLTIPEDPDDA